MVVVAAAEVESSSSSRSRSSSSSSRSSTTSTTATATATASVIGFKSWMNGHAGFLNVPGMDVYHLVGALFLESGWHVTIGIHKAPRKLWVCFPWMPLAGFAWHFSAKVVCRHTEWSWLWLWSHEFFMTWSIVLSCDRCMTKAATATRKTRTTNTMTNRNRMDKKERQASTEDREEKKNICTNLHNFFLLLPLATHNWVTKWNPTTEMCKNCSSRVEGLENLWIENEGQVHLHSFAKYHQSMSIHLQGLPNLGDL